MAVKPGEDGQRGFCLRQLRVLGKPQISSFLLLPEVGGVGLPRESVHVAGKIRKGGISDWSCRNDVKPNL